MSDKTEAPTPRRLRRARDEGDSGASAYATQAVAFLVAVALAPAVVRATAERAAAQLRAVLSTGSLAADTASRTGSAARTALGAAGGLPASCGAEVLGLTCPLLAAAGAAAAVVYAAQTSGVVASRRLVPSLARLDPAAGLKALFSGVHLFAVARALLAASAVGVLAYRVVREHIADWGRLAGRLSRVAESLSAGAEGLALRAALVGLALGAIDLVVARQAWLRRLGMTKDEVRREHRDAEGDPQAKAGRQRAYQEMLARATVASVRDASVVVVNPTHLACALRYEPRRGDDVPVILARGKGDLAARLAIAAADHGVPVVRHVPLARALVELEVGDAIPEVLYESVAEILLELSAVERAGAASFPR